MHNFKREWTVAFGLLFSVTSAFAADLPAAPANAMLPGFTPYAGSSGAQKSVTSFAGEPVSDVQDRTDEAFAALGIAPREPAPPRLRPRQEPAAPPSNSVLVFGGQFTTGNMGEALNPFGGQHEDQRIVGVAYERDLFRASYGFVVGAEVGLGFRYGMGSSQELWAGVNFRHTGFALFDLVRIAGGITVGFSAITHATGIEAERQIKDHGSASILAYLGPELTLALLQYPNLELVYRVQHRSGAYGVIANFIEGANANTLGIRYRF